MLSYLSIFWRTFAQLALAGLLVIQVPDLVDSTWIKNTAEATGVTLLAALIGAVVAVLWAFAGSPAASAMEKAIRSAAQAVAGTLGGLVLTTTTDILTAPKVVFGGLIATAVAFGVTFLQYQGSPPVPTPEPAPPPA